MSFPRTTTTHRVVQLSQLEDALSAVARQYERAARNAEDINNQRVVGQFLTRARKARAIATKVRARLAEAELARIMVACKSRI